MSREQSLKSLFCSSVVSMLERAWSSLVVSSGVVTGQALAPEAMEPGSHCPLGAAHIASRQCGWDHTQMLPKKTNCVLEAQVATVAGHSLERCLPETSQRTRAEKNPWEIFPGWRSGEPADI